jgi:hypothetical protein
MSIGARRGFRVIGGSSMSHRRLLMPRTNRANIFFIHALTW